LHALQHVRKAHGWIPLIANMNAVPAGSTAALWTDLCSKFQGQAARFGVHLPSFNSPGAFQRAFMRSTLGNRVRFVLMFDEFDDLDSPRVGTGVKDEVRCICPYASAAGACCFSCRIASEHFA
jgi:hypothetical protein